MEPDDLRKGIVRILKPSDQNQTAGTGFIISPYLVATCAHVISPSGSKPSSVNLILDDGRRLTASVEEQYWRDSRHEDVAILRVHEPFPDHILLKLGTSTNIAGHTFRTYGFPEGYARGILVKGSIDDDRESALLQLTSQEITEGVSGAPVFDQQTHRVVGMITGRAGIDLREVERKIKSKKETVTVATGRLEETAFATPSNVLLQICSELSIEDICPYQGLLAFTEDDSRFFYGRDRLIDKLIENLQRNPRFLAIVGSSGSGKSSVVQAGLLPKLQRGDVPGFQNCQTIKLRPGSTPKQALLSSLLSVFPELQIPVIKVSSFWTTIQQNLQQQQQRLLIFVDQFEEIFALCNLEDRKDFTKGLLNLLRSPFSITLILTIRSDFYDPLLKSGFGEWLETGQVNVLKLSNEELRAAIIRPAKKIGLQLEPGLADLIVRDLEDTETPLPLLEFTLTQLWYREHLNNLLTCNQYQLIGRVTGAIAQWADDTYYSLSESESQIVKQIFTCLIHYGFGNAPYTRRRITLLELKDYFQKKSALHNTIKKLADNRLITTDLNNETSEETIEIIHESLLKEWSLLQQWIEKDRAFRVWQERVQISISQWLSNSEDVDLLIRGSLLREAEEWLLSKSTQLREVEKIFIWTSKRHQEQEKCKERNLHRKIEISEINYLLSYSYEKFQENNRLEALLACIKAGKKLKQVIEPPEEIKGKTLDTLRRVIHNIYECNCFEGHKDRVWSVNFSSSGELIISASHDRTIKLWNLDGELLSNLEGHQDRALCARFSPDEKFIASSSADKTIRFWRLNGKPISVLEGHKKGINEIAFSPRDQVITSASFDGTIKLWNFKGELLNTFEGHDDEVWWVSFRSDGEVIASASSDQTVKLWSVNGDLLKTLPIPNTKVWNANFSPDGRLLASAGSDKFVRLWNLNSNDQPKIFEGHEAMINTVYFSSNGKSLITASDDKTIRLWSSDGTLLRILKGHEEGVNEAAFSPCGQKIVSASYDKKIRVWNLNPFEGADIISFELDKLLLEGCSWVADHLQKCSGMEYSDRCICDDILNQG